MTLPPGVVPEIPGPGQESCWDYPRPPALERVAERIEVRLAGVVVCACDEAFRILETSHPPTYYLPRSGWRPGALRPAPGTSICEWKGPARYFDVVAVDDAGRDVGIAKAAAWDYPEPWAPFSALAGHVSVYPAAMDAVTVDGELVQPQAGGFYGGWITSRVVGPFKGGPGSRGW